MKKLVKGSRRDELPPDIPEGSWIGAKNIVNYKKFGSISNEDGADNITPISIPSTIFENFPSKPVIGIIPITKMSVFFFAPSIKGNDSEIGILDEQDRYYPIQRDSNTKEVLNFDINFPIQGTFEYKFNNNLIIAFRDNKNDPRIINANCLPYSLDVDYTVSSSDLAKAKALIKLFPDVSTPQIANLFLTDNGGNLEAGTYYPIVSYELADKSTTSWLKVYNPFPVVQDSTSIPFKDYDGDLSGTSTSKKLHIQFNSVDTNYLNLRFGVIKLKDGQYSAFYISSFKISGTILDIDYTGTESTINSITLDEVLVPNAVYKKVGTITNLLGDLYLGDVEKRNENSLQQYVNMINLQWTRGDYINLDTTEQNSYKNEKIVFFNKHFRSDEVYAFYLNIKWKDGTYSDAYHIPGRPPLSHDRDTLLSTGLPGTVKKFQLQETALFDGTMGYWENETDFYPNTDDFNSTGLGGLDLRGLPVRHHKFPSIAKIIEGGEAFFKKFDKVGGQIVFNNPTLDDPTPHIGVDSYKYNIVSNTTSLTITDPGTYDDNQLTNAVANRIIQIRGTIVYNITGIQPTGLGSTITIQSFIYGNDGQQYLLDTIVVTYAMTGGTGNYSGSIDCNKYWILFAISDFMTLSLNVEDQNVLVNTDFTGTNITIEEGIQEAASRPFGIKISNFNVPPSLLSEIDSWEISYAERNIGNIRVIGQDMIKGNRLHSFDLVYNQANLRGDFVKYQLTFQYDSLTSASPLTANYLLNPMYENPRGDYTVLTSFYYLGGGVTFPIDNTNKSTSIYAAPILDIGDGNDLFDINIYRKDVYKSFDSQTLISMGQGVKVISSGIQPTKELYGGDTFISQYGFIEDYPANAQYLIPQESAANIGLRMDDLISTPSKYYFPKHTNSNPQTPSISYYGYNNDYTALNGLNKIFPRVIDFNNCLSNIYKFPYLIAYSLTDANESLKLNWRIFPINNYYDQLPKNKGKLWNLLGSNRTLYIQQEYALLIAEIKDTLNASGQVVALATSGLFSRPPVEVIPTDEGYVGSQCQFASIMTPMGYITIDRQRGKIFAYQKDSQLGLSEISNEGWYGFFNKNTQTINQDVDNPFIGNGLIATYDLDFKRLIVVKKDGNYEFTASYCSDTKQWICLHDYHPNYIFTTRNGMYAGVNSNFQLYKHNSDTLKGIFYDGIMYDSYIDVPFNEKQDITKIFANFNWITIVQRLDGVVMDNETLTDIMIYNSNQCSGKLNLQADGGLWFGKDARNTEETWNFNKFRDLVKDTNNRFIDNYGELITSNINNNKAWFEKSKFISKFVIVRFIYNNVNQRDIHIVSVDTNQRESNR